MPTPTHRQPRLIAAAATPVTPGGTCNGPLFLAHLEALLARGCDAVALFGTTGEGPALTVAERHRALDGVLASGIRADRLIMAAMSAAPGDIAELCCHALASGVTRLLVMPPFFFRDGQPQDLEGFYGRLVEQLGDARARILLYHFPAMSGAMITVKLAMSLRERYGAVIEGLKDSTGKLDGTLALIRDLPGLDIYCGTENQLPEVVAAGGAGTICGLANAVPELVGELMTATDPAVIARARERILALEALMAEATFNVALKAALAALTGEPDWVRPLPPLAALPEVAAERQRRELALWQGEQRIA